MAFKLDLFLFDVADGVMLEDAPDAAAEVSSCFEAGGESLCFSVLSLVSKEEDKTVSADLLVRIKYLQSHSQKQKIINCYTLF